MINPRDIAAAHDAMASEYDQIDDLWHAHLFNQIHRFIVTHLRARVGEGAERRALDVGCGTGFQSMLLARAGYRVRGFDIAAQLVAAAIEKNAALVRRGHAPAIFASSLPDVMTEQREILDAADRLRSGPIAPADFFLGDALAAASYEPGDYDAVVCCGSVLNFIDEPELVIQRIATSLKPNGLLFLEVEQRVNLDLLWPLADIVSGGRLRYEQGARETLGNIFTPPGADVRVDYPFVLHDGSAVTMPMRLFSVDALHAMFARQRLTVLDRLGVHALTNLIPSTVLHLPRPGRLLIAAFRAMARLEKRVGRAWPIWRSGSSVVYALCRA